MTLLLSLFSVDVVSTAPPRRTTCFQLKLPRCPVTAVCAASPGLSIVVLSTRCRPYVVAVPSLRPASASVRFPHVAALAFSRQQPAYTGNAGSGRWSDRGRVDGKEEEEQWMDMRGASRRGTSRRGTSMRGTRYTTVLQRSSQGSSQ